MRCWCMVRGQEAGACVLLVHMVRGQEGGVRRVLSANDASASSALMLAASLMPPTQAHTACHTHHNPCSQTLTFLKGKNNVFAGLVTH